MPYVPKYSGSSVEMETAPVFCKLTQYFALTDGKLSPAESCLRSDVWNEQDVLLTCLQE